MHVITGLETGGAERMLANLCIANKLVGRPPVVVSLRPGGSQYDRLIEAGVRVMDLNMRSGVPSPAALWRLAQLIRDERPEVIQAWMYHADLYALWALVLSGRAWRTRLYAGIRCSEMDFAHYPLAFRLVVRLDAMQSHFTNGVVFNSEAGRRTHRRLGYSMRGADVIDNGIDTKAFRPDPAARAPVRATLGIASDAFVIGSVARVDAMKDYPTLLDALQRLDGVTCVAAGAGTETLDGPPGFKPLGRRDDVARLLHGFDVLVSASAFGEGFSNAIAEAMASGIPVVATDVGDARRIVGDGGLIVPPRDPAALAEAIARLRDDAMLRVRLAIAARNRIESHFSLDAAVAAFDALHDGARAKRDAA
ncbi:MAG: glycosyltransferase [Alphaproteobacteria bacterium]|nr:glycosyltransferase [Alphaproteobacteria bacterium]